MIDSVLTKVDEARDDGQVAIGRHSYYHGNPFILHPAGRIEVGSFCSIALEVRLLSGGEHALDLPSTYPLRTFLTRAGGGDWDCCPKGPIRIGSDVWIGHGSLVISGVTIGHGAVIAIDPQTGQKKWSFDMYDITMSGILTTASDLLFVGGRDKSRMHLHWARKRISWRNFFLSLDRLTHWFERVHIRPLRSLALKKAEKWMLERFEMSDGLGAIYPSMMNAIIALRCLGYSVDDPQFIRAFDEFEKLGIEEGDTFRMQPCMSPV